jgi:Xaa-Pro aminopeptidase
MARITEEEIRQRAARSAEALARESLDALLLLPGPSFAWLTGLRFARERHRLLAALLGRDGRLWLMGPVFEADKLAGSPVPSEVVTWSDEDDQYGRVAATARAAFGAQPAIGLEPTAALYHAARLRAALGGPAPPLSAVVERLRAIKSPAEIACLRQAAARTRARMERVPALLEAGMTELELARAFGPGAMVQFGPTTSRPNEVAGERELREGDPIVIDAGDRVEGYRSDLTRTFCFGRPSRRLLEVHRVVRAAEDAALAAARPGAPAAEVDLAARRVIDAAGFGAFFTHRGGHGIGLDFHELPLCVGGGPDVLEPGNALTAEPGIYLPGEFGVRLEDDILVTASGPELLSERGPFLDD